MNDHHTGQVVTFYSYKGGTGRSMALANVAWILAANGKRVLVADWDLESPGLHRFFKPFLPEEKVRGTAGIIDLIRAYEDETREQRKRPKDWHEEFARVKQHAVSLTWDFPDGGTLDFLSAGRQNQDYSVTVSGLDWDDFYERLGGARFFDALRTNMKQNYDYTLIDSRTGLSDVADICTLHLPDTLVDCFTLSDQGIDGAARVAERVLLQHRPIRIMPVPMRVDPAEKEKADAGRALAMLNFPGLPGELSEEERLRYWGSVEVPYRAFYAYEETLATFGDPPGSPTSLLASYEKLTAAITGGEVTSFPALAEPVREHWGRLYQRRRTPAPVGVLLQYVADDQVWADWIEQVLLTARVPVWNPGPMESEGTDAVPPPNRRVLAVVSPRYLDVLQGSFRTREPWGQLGPLAVHIADVRPLDASVSAVSLLGLTPEAAAERLLTLVGLRSAPRRIASQVARFPGAEPRWFQVPARNVRFTGRSHDLESLRRELQRAGTAVVLPVSLQGMGGVGKTQLALEYAHRFRTAYDLVWWISAEQAQFVDAALADLAGALELPMQQKASDAAQTTLEALRRGHPTGRWLIVFDNAEDPAALENLLPSGSGHVLVTSRNNAWDDKARSIRVDVFKREESISHLHGRVASITREEADQVADALGDLPLAVAVAGAWLAETGTRVPDYLREIERSTASLRLEATWDLSLERLRSQSAGAYRLLQICSVLAPEIGLELLYSDEMAAALSPFDPSVSDRLMRGRLVQRINRLGLLKLDVHAGQIQVHRLLQAVVRERMAGELPDVRHQAHLVLAKSRPSGEVDDPATWPRFRMLWPHLEISEAVNCTDESVRQLLIDRVRYLWRRGDLERGEEFGLRVAAVWDSLLDPDRTAGSAEVDQVGTHRADQDALRRQLLHLRFNIANHLRDQSRFEDALETDLDVLEHQTTLLGPRHSHTLMTAGGHAADLRALGRYREALPFEEATYRAWSEEFGEDHPRTLASANNLAVSYRAVGDFRRARTIDEDVLRRRRLVLGPAHPYTLHSASCLGRDLREAGEYRKSLATLQEVLRACREELEPSAAVTLTAQANLAASLRSAGEAHEAAPLLDDALDRFRERFFPGAPETLACQLNRAANLLATNQVDDAVLEMRLATESYENRLRLGPNHPMTLVCKSNLSAALRASGQHQEARLLADEAAHGCARSVGAEHPYTLAAAMNLATCLHDEGDLAAAAERLEEVSRIMSQVLGATHPDSLACRVNLQIVDPARDGGTAGSTGTSALDQLTGHLGAGHPTVRELRAGRPVYRVIDPHDPY